MQDVDHEPEGCRRCDDLAAALSVAYAWMGTKATPESKHNLEKAKLDVKAALFSAEL